MRLSLLILFAFVAGPGIVVGQKLSNVNNRGSLSNSKVVFEKSGKGHVAFMGGSITEMDGYRPIVSKWIQEQFPKADLTFTAAGISSTCSTTGAMRLQRDVLSKGPVDLFLVEFAVNDDQDAAHSSKQCMQGLEGIVRQIRRHNRNADIVIVYFCNLGMVEQIQAGKTPLTIAAHERIAQRYKISSVNVAAEVAHQITAEKLTWKQYGGTHPSKFGNGIAAKMVTDLLSLHWSDDSAESLQVKAHEMSATLEDEDSFINGRLLDSKRVSVVQSFEISVPNWSEIKGGKRERYLKETMVHTDKLGAELTLEFEGKAIGAFVLAGPDAGTVEVRVNQRPPQVFDLYHRFSKNLHYPRTIIFADDLQPGHHVLRLRVVDSKNEATSGNAVRVLSFTGN